MSLPELALGGLFLSSYAQNWAEKTVLAPCRAPFLAVKVFPGWVWFESRMCREWLHLCEVWGRKTQNNWGYVTFNNDARTS